SKLDHSSLQYSFRRHPRGGIEMDQFGRLVDMIKEVNLNTSDDRWVWELDSTGVETASHLFFSCSMARAVVKLITRWWCIPDVELESFEDWVQWHESDKARRHEILCINKAMFGDNGSLDNPGTVTRPSNWLNIIREFNSLSSKGIHLLSIK
ncbi:hypothetical protein Tco_1433590, partial [Tanacetum coccineum]